MPPRFNKNDTRARTRTRRLNEDDVTAPETAIPRRRDPLERYLTLVRAEVAKWQSGRRTSDEAMHSIASICGNAERN